MTLDLPTVEISKRYLMGESTVDIAKYFNCSINVITLRLLKSGIKIRTIKESITLKLPLDEIVKKYLNGETTVELAKYYGCSIPTIKHRLQQTNIKIRTYGESLKGRKLTNEHRQRVSAGLQGIPYDKWESYAQNQLYCPSFNEECKESNREKYDRRCFLCNLPEEENITSTGKQQKLSVHHVDMDKMQGCGGKRWKLVPLCIHCHGPSHTELWEIRIIWLLENIWK